VRPTTRCYGGRSTVRGPFPNYNSVAPLTGKSAEGGFRPPTPCPPMALGPDQTKLWHPLGAPDAFPPHAGGLLGPKRVSDIVSWPSANHVGCALGCRWLQGRGTSWSGRAAARPRAVHRIKIQPYCPIFPQNRTLCRKFAAAAVWPREAVRALSGQPKGSCHGLRPSGGTAGDRGPPQPKPRSQNAAKMQPKWPCLKLWPHTGQYV
jgi:hypothetical protein